jgi:hypothetical protein
MRTGGRTGCWRARRRWKRFWTLGSLSDRRPGAALRSGKRLCIPDTTYTAFVCIAAFSFCIAI